MNTGIEPWLMVSPRSRPVRGFALLLTVTLLAFVAVMLVSLAAYTRIESAAAGNTQFQAQAREHALLALNLALAQLQMHAGPDARVTATTQSFGGVDGTSYYTGVWNTGPEGDNKAPLTWLVSGNEAAVSALPSDKPRDEPVAAPLAVTPADPGRRTVELVGRNTTGSSHRGTFVVAPLVDIPAPGVPGTARSSTSAIGRYAWWVGDQGVKAAVATPDLAPAIDYEPFATDERRERLRQQFPSGVPAVDATARTIFDSHDANNIVPVGGSRVVAFNQLAFLHRAETSDPLGFTTLQSHFHVWSPWNLAVLADTGTGGLRRDLSVAPSWLGDAFAAWSYYPEYMEPIPPAAAASGPPLLPSYDRDPLRRRYRLAPPLRDRGIAHGIAPVLSFFGLSFSFRNDTDGARPVDLEASARCVVGLWNPYSAALVPEDLQLVVTGLPDVIVRDTAGNTRTVRLEARMGAPLTFSLPFTENPRDPDRSSWLPGRVYNWSAQSNTADPGEPGNAMLFYRRDAVPAGGSGIVRVVGPALGRDVIAGVPTYRQCRVAEPQTLTLELRRADDGALLRTFASPRFDAFQTDAETRSTGDRASDFAYIFRLPEATELPEGESARWLQAPGRDPREWVFPVHGKSGYVVVAGQPPRPELLVTRGQAGFPATYSQLLLDRYTNAAGRNYSEDVPVFELPRGPLLSLGALQHLHVEGARPFAVGNSWGGPRNAWFDRYFFSGLTPAARWNDVSRPLPNSLLKVLPRRPDGTSVTIADFTHRDRRIDGHTSRYVLQGGAFNLNSVDPLAWAAVLRSIRFRENAEFLIHDLDESTGAGADTSRRTREPFLSRSRVCGFPRFPQSAHETFEAIDGHLQSEPGVPANINNAPLFRRGVRFLSAAETATLAGRIAELMRRKHADSGPFRSLEEFLNPFHGFVDASGSQVSLLEKAIEDAGLNTDAALGLAATTAEFSSQWLIQGDLMTALAPVLFSRSDTFVIRAYGEAVNPATGERGGRAWCEAIAQRMPEYFDSAADAPEVMPAALASKLNQLHGRRFKVVTFRWLTRHDI